MNAWFATPFAKLLLASLIGSILLTLLANTAFASLIPVAPCCALPVVVPLLWWYGRSKK